MPNYADPSYENNSYDYDYAPQQQYYGAPQVADEHESLINGDSFKSWMITGLFMNLIPIVRLIFCFIWGFGQNAVPARKNWARAWLVWYAIKLIIVIFFGAFIMSMIMSLFAGGSSTYYLNGY